MTACSAQNKVSGANNFRIRVSHRDRPARNFKAWKIVKVVADINNILCFDIFLLEDITQRAPLFINSHPVKGLYAHLSCTRLHNTVRF